MSIAEKLTTVAENVPKVYKAGQASMVDESKIVPKTVSGTSISVNDVSEIPHSVSCKVESINLFQPKFDSKVEEGVTITKNADNSFSLTGTFLNSYFSGSVTLGEFDCSSINQLYVSGGTKKLPLVLWLRVGVLGADEIVYNTGGVTVINTEQYSGFTLRVKLTQGQTVNGTIKPVISLYNHSTFTPYVSLETIKVVKYGADESEGYQSLTPNADGIVEGMTSTSPYMNILSETDGVVFNVTYNKSWGMQYEHDRIWDDVQQNGNRTNYREYFMSKGWKSGTTYNPKHPITCGANGATSMFNGSPITDTLVPISISGANLSVFYGSSIKTIPLLIIGSGISSMGDWFNNMTNLEDITIEGEIYLSTKFAQSTKLTAKSMVSIVEHLSSSVTGKSLTFNSTAVANADWSTTDYASFDELIATKPNWTIGV